MGFFKRYHISESKLAACKYINLIDNKISNKDKEDWLEFIEGKEKLVDKDLKFQKNIIHKTRSVDLHGCTLEEANKFIKDFIEKSYKDKVSKLIVITGKGLHSDKEKIHMCQKILVY